MEADLRGLEERVGQFVALCRRLRAENQQLRQELAERISENKQLTEKVNAAKSRLSTLLESLPEGE